MTWDRYRWLDIRYSNNWWVIYTSQASSSAQRRPSMLMTTARPSTSSTISSKTRSQPSSDNQSTGRVLFGLPRTQLARLPWDSQRPHGPGQHPQQTRRGGLPQHWGVPGWLRTHLGQLQTLQHQGHSTHLFIQWIYSLADKLEKNGKKMQKNYFPHIPIQTLSTLCLIQKPWPSLQNLPSQLKQNKRTSSQSPRSVTSSSSTRMRRRSVWLKRWSWPTNSRPFRLPRISSL